MDMKVEWQTKGERTKISLDKSEQEVDAVYMGDIRQAYTIDGHEHPIVILQKKS